eukprot:RCo046319
MRSAKENGSVKWASEELRDRSNEVVFIMEEESARMRMQSLCDEALYLTARQHGCTFPVNGPRAVPGVPLFQCRTCLAEQSGEGASAVVKGGVCCCFVCAAFCHRGHDVVRVRGPPPYGEGAAPIGEDRMPNPQIYCLCGETHSASQELDIVRRGLAAQIARCERKLANCGEEKQQKARRLERNLKRLRTALRKETLHAMVEAVSATLGDDSSSNSGSESEFPKTCPHPETVAPQVPPSPKPGAPRRQQ